MGFGIRHGVLIAALGVAAGPAAAQRADSLPDGVTPAMVAAGKKYFEGEGLCTACHGQDAKGMLGPNLTDKVWLHGKGHYREIVAQILAGVPMDSSRSGQIMPPRGGSALDDEQVRAVAAYVWTLSRGRKP
jgi:mono/diheme cytochrome c family protein